MRDEGEFYQVERIKSELTDLKKGQHEQMLILQDMSNVFKKIGDAIEGYSELNTMQVRHGETLKNLVADNKEFKQFRKDCPCSQHSAEIKTLSKADDSKNKNTATLVITFLGSLVTGLLTWIILKG